MLRSCGFCLDLGLGSCGLRVLFARLDLWHLVVKIFGWDLHARSTPAAFALDLGLGSLGVCAVFLRGFCQEFGVWGCVWRVDLGGD